MTYRFYITELFNGRIIGTDDETIAGNYASSEDAFVVDTSTGKWLTHAGPFDIDPADDPSGPSDEE